MTQPSRLELAKQGDPKAISALLNQQLKYQGIRSKVALKEGCLHVLLESADRVPERYNMVDFVRVKLVNLEAESIERVVVYGRQKGDEKPAWHQEFALVVGGYSDLLFSKSHQTASPVSTETEETSEITDTESPPKKTPQRRLASIAIGAISLVLLAALAIAYIAMNSSPGPSHSHPEKQLSTN